MLWGYMENVQDYFSPVLYEKYGKIFGTIWIASAYKGASGEITYFTSIQHHYLNHIAWISIIKEKLSRNIVKFRGIALTGWSRYFIFCFFLIICLVKIVGLF